MNALDPWYIQLQKKLAQPETWQKLHIDLPLFSAVTLLTSMGLFILYSASDQSTSVLGAQCSRLLLAFGLMCLCAQISPASYRRMALPLYLLSCFLLLLVLFSGHTSKGAQRWFNLGIVHFQPTELLKLTLPLFLSHYLADQKLPPRPPTVWLLLLIALIPMGLVIKQPDLGSGLLLAGILCIVLLLAGLHWKWWLGGFIGILATVPFFWKHLHGYQKQRILMFLNPEQDPLGNGYHIIQSKIAIGSGGWYGKGWLNGTQSHLSFLPEHATDFIFAVCGEELGLWGCLLLISLYVAITARALYISAHAQDTFTRLLSGSLSLSLLLSMFINMGMVTGLLPVVGLPLPLVSYGGSAPLIFCAMFGILMSIHTHRRLVG